MIDLRCHGYLTLQGSVCGLGERGVGVFDSFFFCWSNRIEKKSVACPFVFHLVLFVHFSLHVVEIRSFNWINCLRTYNII